MKDATHRRHAIDWAITRTIGWIRLGPLSVQVKNRRFHSPLFSERYGYRRWLYLGNIGLRVAWRSL